MKLEDICAAMLGLLTAYTHSIDDLDVRRRILLRSLAEIEDELDTLYE